MGVFGLSKACALLLAAGMMGAEAASYPQDAQSSRVLRAATKRSDLTRRSLRIGKKFESEIVYIEEENIWSPGPVFASKVKVSSKKPILNLEDIEHHLEDVHCGDGSMKLSFRDPIAARDAKAACHSKHGGLIITSHNGCNPDGERAVYQVNDASFAEDGQALELIVAQSLWKNSFDSFDISFGHTEDDVLYRRHSDFQRLRRRQDEPKDDKKEDTKEGDKKVKIPGNAADDVNTATFNLKYEVVDHTFSVDEIMSSTYLDQVVGTPNLPNIPIEVGCKKCATQGKIILSQGAIKINVAEIDIVPDVFGADANEKEVQTAKKDTSSIISGGFMELATKGMGGKFELFARPQKTGSLSIGLPPIPALGFVIPGIGQAGVSFETSLNLDFEIIKGLELYFGAEIKVPDGTIRLELGDLAKSGINGFKKAQIKALPFKANLTDIDILVGVGVNPTIPIGFEFSDKLEASISVDMDLPRLDARIRTMKDVDSNCEPQKKKTKEGDAKKAEVETQNNEVEALGKKMGPLVLVEGNVSVSVDVNMELALPLLPAPFDGIGTQVNIFTTMIPLPTTCLAAGKKWAAATEVFGGAKPTAAGGPDAQQAEVSMQPGQPGQPGETPAPCSTSAGDVPPPPPPPTDAPAPPCDCGTVTVYVPPPTDAPMPPPPENPQAPPPENPQAPPPENPQAPPPENPQAPPPENPQTPPPENPEAPPPAAPPCTTTPPPEAPTPPPENPPTPPPENPEAPPPEKPQNPPPENPEAPPPEKPQTPPPENPEAPPPEKPENPPPENPEAPPPAPPATDPAKPPCTTTPPPEAPTPPPENPPTPPPENPQTPPPENPEAPPPENPQTPPPENPQTPPPENPEAPPPEKPENPPPENPEAPPPAPPATEPPCTTSAAPPPPPPAETPCTTSVPPPPPPAETPCTTSAPPPPPPVETPTLNTTCTGNGTAPPPPPAEETPVPPPADTPSEPIVTDPAPTPTGPTGGVTAPTGFMDGTPSGPPTSSSTEPLEFTSAAVPRAVARIEWGTIGWQLGLLAASFGIGGAIVL